ncbi:hypothetical protein WQ57_23205 [Mesobacillus campisalis]|uniref:Sortilin N-terminal domain-containing protein n=1 Tax=Mesobacillus campisalis TaxID=1408103 RepID=A0A0M2SI21_9BACI|nr:hypothetical protein [Mesobacillus campisalis]KKK34334.1 hypothetical protein WQ57_23205 [Mesobacillus campisalis]
MKSFKVVAGVLALAIVASGCSSTKEAGSGEKRIEKGFRAEHLHGIAYAADETIYITTHEGMLATQNGGMEWTMKGNYDFDFMGFNVMSDGSMITSGHPGKASSLLNPLGVMVSENNGEEWESESLLGKVDFHILTANYSNPSVIYGINQMDSGNYKTGIYKSMDKGKEWERIDSEGLPNDLHQIYTLISSPDDENSLLAGTSNGVMQSYDGGESWEVTDSSRLITAVGVISGSKQLVSYSITNRESGIMSSGDFGKTWTYHGLDLGEDAVAYIGIHPIVPDKMVVATFENTVLSSKDGGGKWTTLLDKGAIQ